MNPEARGLHHFTAIASDPTENAKFYVNTLGMRMVKKTVNHDAPDVYHLFYGDRKGTPGSSITFFPGMTDQEGKTGSGMITELGLRVPDDSIEYWKNRLDEENIEFEEEKWHGKNTVSFEDPHGMPLRLVPGKSESFETWKKSKVPEEHQIQGMHHVTLSVHREEDIAPILNELGMEKTDGLFEMEDGSKIEVFETDEHGRMGKGSAHHVAFKTGDEREVEKMREKLNSIGMRPSPVISRKYFTSTYTRTSVGILFEFSSMGPGYAADEDVEELGENFVLPENLQDRREEIIKNLPEFNENEIR